MRLKDYLIAGTLLLIGSLFIWHGLTPTEPTGPQSVTARSISYQPPIQQPQFEEQAIETIRVGQRMWIGDNPSEERDYRVGEDIRDPSQWRKMVLRCPKRDGSFANVEMLRPVAWLEERNVRPGGKAEINVPECGIEGLADVLDVQLCPPISGGQGRVVTATFHHQAAAIIDIAIEGLDEPIGSTPNHPIWSETEKTFVRADQLRPDEKVRTVDGIALVKSITPRELPEPVYNLEVQLEHVYRVGNAGVLVHNGTPECLDFAREQARQNGGSVLRIDPPGGPVRGGLNAPGYDVPQNFHAVNVRDGRVFDPVNPDGIPVSQYLEDFAGANNESINSLERFFNISTE